VSAPPKLIDERWELGPLLGSGGSGRVWRATDRATGKAVAVKVVRALSDVQRARVAREIRAMQALKIAGVVRLHAVGETRGDPYLVMELVNGTCFPGEAARGGWAALSQPFLALLQVLAQVHAAGFVHRDLKPDNALVGPDGQVTLLDFGLARDLEGEVSLTGDGGGPQGTPGYLAPEQLLGGKADARSDLYAVGVMLFEALTGRPPQDGADFWRHVTERRVPPCPRLLDVAPGVEPGLAAVVDALLQLDPADRPPNAQAVLARLRALEADRRPDRLVQLPFLGREAELQSLRASAMRGESREVWGAPGSGRRRLLAEVALRLEADGVPVLRPAPAGAPLASLGSPLGKDEGEVAARLFARMAEGLVVVVDDEAALDTASADLVREARDWGAVLRVADTPSALHLEPLAVEDLRPLFHGPDRVLHLRDDAAEELHARAGGLPERLASMLQAWVTARLCAWDAGRMRIDQAALDQLRAGLRVGVAAPWMGDRSVPLQPEDQTLLAWIVLGAASLDVAALARLVDRPVWEVRARVQGLERASGVRQRPGGRLEATIGPVAGLELDEAQLVSRHRAIAEVLPYGSEERLRQWHLAGADANIAEEAAAVAERHAEAGRAARASATMAAAWRSTRALGSEARYVFAQTWASCAIDAGDVPAAAEALTGRTVAREPKVLAVGELLQAFRDAASGMAGDAAERAAALGPFDHPELELHRISLLVRAAVERGDSIEPLLRDAAPGGSPLAAERHAGWRGLSAYHRGDFRTAAAWHARAAALSVSPRRRCVALVNECSARLDVDDVASAAAVITPVLADVERHRFADLEGWAVGILRCARYRLGEDPEPDPEWVAVSREAGPLQRHAHACLIEAAIHWRRGTAAEAAELAAESAYAFRMVGRRDLGVLPEALRRLNGGLFAAGEEAAQAAELAAARAPRFSEQAQRILDAIDAAGGDLARASRALLDAEAPGAVRRDVLAVDPPRR
jgi:hypothetical protein